MPAPVPQPRDHGPGRTECLPAIDPHVAAPVSPGSHPVSAKSARPALLARGCGAIQRTCRFDGVGRLHRLPGEPRCRHAYTRQITAAPGRQGQRRTNGRVTDRRGRLGCALGASCKGLDHWSGRLVRGVGADRAVLTSPGMLGPCTRANMEQTCGQKGQTKNDLER